MVRARNRAVVHRPHDAGEHQAAGHRVNVLGGLGALLHNGGGAPLDVAHRGQEKENRRVHQIEANDLLN